jgi:hypothetical protein
MRIHTVWNQYDLWGTLLQDTLLNWLMFNHRVGQSDTECQERAWPAVGWRLVCRWWQSDTTWLTTRWRTRWITSVGGLLRASFLDLHDNSDKREPRHRQLVVRLVTWYDQCYEWLWRWTKHQERDTIFSDRLSVIDHKIGSRTSWLIVWTSVDRQTNQMIEDRIESQQRWWNQRMTEQSESATNWWREG